MAIREKYHCIATGVIDELGVAKFSADWGVVRATHILPFTWIELAEIRFVGLFIARFINAYFPMLEAEQSPHLGFAEGLEWFGGGGRSDCRQERIVYQPGCWLSVHVV